MNDFPIYSEPEGWWQVSVMELEGKRLVDVQAHPHGLTLTVDDARRLEAALRRAIEAASLAARADAYLDRLMGLDQDPEYRRKADESDAEFRARIVRYQAGLEAGFADRATRVVPETCAQPLSVTFEDGEVQP